MGPIQPVRIDTPEPYTPPSRLSKWIIVWLFRQSVHEGRLAIQFPDEIVEVGAGSLVCTIAPPSLLRFVWMLLKPDYRLPSQYTSGFWLCENGKLKSFLALLTSQERSPLHWWFQLWNRSPIRDRFIYRLFPLKVKEKIAQHYNTDPAFMRLILGPQLEYTCAFFDGPETDLDTAQRNKINKVIERLKIVQADNILDLGCGWGQIAETVATETGATVTGLNITPNQIAYAQSQASENTSFVLSDYERFVPSAAFTKLFSIGMREHIGKGKLKNYFSKISELLEPGGTALVHCIVRTQEGATNSWIDDAVFPGAYVAELGEITKAIDQSPLEVETIFTHRRTNYSLTLEAWTVNFYRNWDALLRILLEVVSEKEALQIMRIWEFYLSGSQLVFDENIGYCYNVQIVLSRPVSD